MKLTRKLFILLLLVIVFISFIFIRDVFNLHIVTFNSQPLPNNLNKVQLTEKEILDYFYEVVLSDEYSSGTVRDVVAKWDKQDVCIKVLGNSNEYLNKCVENVVNDFNRLSSTAKLKVNQLCNDIEMYIIPYERFKSIIPEFNEDNGDYGYFFITWDNNYVINHSIVLINSNENDRDVERCHLFREELTQSMGLANDSNKYKDSIFTKEFNPTLYYLDIDKEIIKLLYSGKIKAGMSKKDIGKYFNITTN